MTYKFDDEADLGKVVSNVKPFCKLTKKMDIPTERDILGDFNDLVLFPGLVGKKWSRLCGFTFASAVQKGRTFQFVYVPKLRGTLVRNQKALSGWYCWEVVSDGTRKILSLLTVKNLFGFEINKFVYSDLFDKYVDIFKSNITYALDHQVKELLDRSEELDNYPELLRNVNAIRESVGKMLEVKKDVIDVLKTVDLDNGKTIDIQVGTVQAMPNANRYDYDDKTHAKVAYNANATYSLPNHDQKRQDALKARRQDIAQTLQSYRRKDH